MSNTTTATVNGTKMKTGVWCPLEPVPVPDEGADLSKLPNRVAEMMAGRSILITGGTGFIGKVLTEKVLRTCSDVDTIYVLIRTKKGKDARQRVEDILASPVGNRSEQERPHCLHSAILKA
jgi:hypothetical protein